MSDAFRIVFRVEVYTPRGFITLERRGDGSTWLKINGASPSYEGTPLDLLEIAALAQAIGMAEAAT